MQQQLEILLHVKGSTTIYVCAHALYVHKNILIGSLILRATLVG